MKWDLFEFIVSTILLYKKTVLFDVTCRKKVISPTTYPFFFLLYVPKKKKGSVRRGIKKNETLELTTLFYRSLIEKTQFQVILPCLRHDIVGT